jgi:hypothetical protein
MSLRRQVFEMTVVTGKELRIIKPRKKKPLVISDRDSLLIVRMRPAMFGDTTTRAMAKYLVNVRKRKSYAGARALMADGVPIGSIQKVIQKAGSLNFVAGYRWIDRNVQETLGIIALEEEIGLLSDDDVRRTLLTEAL